MIVLRRKNFSEEEEKRDFNNSAAIGAGLLGGGFVGQTIAGVKALNSADIAPELSKKLEEEAIERGAKFSPGYAARNQTGPAYMINNDTVYKAYKDDAAMLSHELGHRHYIKEKSKGVGKVAHKIYKLGGGLQPMVIAPTAGIVAGAVSGKKKARAEAKGEQEGKISKHVGWAVPLLATTPCLVSEAAATKKGLQILKQAGASKEVMKNSKKKLGLAYGTYLATGAMNAGIGEIAKKVAYNREKKKLSSKKDEE